MQPDTFVVDYNGVELTYLVGYGTPEHEQLVRWVEANGVAPDRVAVPGVATIRGDQLTVELYDVDERGHHIADELGTGAVRSTVTVPLVEGPPAGGIGRGHDRVR